MNYRHTIVYRQGIIMSSGKKVKEMRNNEGLTQQALSDMTGIPVRTIKGSEGAEDKALSLSNLQKIIGVPALSKYKDFLLGLEDLNDIPDPDIDPAMLMSEKLIHIRNKEHCNQVNFADICGFQLVKLRAWENGKETITDKDVSQILQVPKFSKYERLLKTNDTEASKEAKEFIEAGNKVDDNELVELIVALPDDEQEQVVEYLNFLALKRMGKL